MPRKRKALTAAEARAVMDRSTQKGTKAISAKVHQYVDQSDPEQARRGLQFVCAQGLFGEAFVEYLDAELLALRRRLQAEGVLDAEGWPREQTGSGAGAG